MPEKVLFTKSVDIVPIRRGVYKSMKDDFVGFKLLVQTEEVEQDGIKKRMPVHRVRHWGDDPEFDEVMSNLGLSGAEGEEVPQQLVFGWANVSVQEDGTTPFDWQGDTIDTDVLEAAAYNLVLNHQFPILNQEHEYDTECGFLVESMVFTKEKMASLGIPEGMLPEGWFVGFYIPDPAVYKKVVDGEYNMFSIEGTARRIPIDGAAMIDGDYANR